MKSIDMKLIDNNFESLTSQELKSLLALRGDTERELLEELITIRDETDVILSILMLRGEV
jgi:hypothetical protein